MAVRLEVDRSLDGNSEFGDIGRSKVEVNKALAKAFRTIISSECGVASTDCPLESCELRSSTISQSGVPEAALQIYCSREVECIERTQAVKTKILEQVIAIEQRVTEAIQQSE